MMNVQQEKQRDKAIKEIAEYCGGLIHFRNEPFPSNHLTCVRGKYCDWLEFYIAGKQYVDVYIKETPIP